MRPTVFPPAPPLLPRRSPHALSERAQARAAGVLVGAAAGDALGVPYEFKPRLAAQDTPRMVGGGLGPYAPGEYSDDTQMQWCIAQVAASGVDLRTPTALDRIARNFNAWIEQGASDHGAQTAAVLAAARRATGRPAEAMTHAAHEFGRARSRSAGNGSLMRTAIVALAYLGDPIAMAQAARRISNLTHADPLCADACVLWCSGIATAVMDATFAGVRDGLELIPASRRAQWSAWLDEAEGADPHHFSPNGYVVTALQAAWSAITRTPIPEDRPARGSFASQHFQLALEAAVRAGNDTDTVAAIAGALLGARWGIAAIPLDWQQAINGWPKQTASDLMRLAVLTARRGRRESNGWPAAPQMPLSVHAKTPFAVPHPYDGRVFLGNLAHAAQPGRHRYDAVVSLCRTGAAPLTPEGVEHVPVWLVDRPGANEDPHFVLDQAARQVLRLRREGKTVLLHCIAGRSRTPAVAAHYARLIAPDQTANAVLASVFEALGRQWRLPYNPDLHAAVYELAGEEPQLAAQDVPDLPDPLSEFEQPTLDW